MVDFTQEELRAILTTMQGRIDSLGELLNEADAGEVDMTYSQYRDIKNQRKLLMKVYFKSHEGLFGREI